MDEDTKKELKEYIKSAFPNGDLEAHRRCHEAESERRGWYKSFYRKIIERAVLSILTVLGAWGLLSLWEAFKEALHR